MSEQSPTLARRIVLKGLAAAGTVGGVIGSASAGNHNDDGGSGGGADNRNPRLELVGHTTLGARDGGNTYGDVNEEFDLAAVGSFVFGNNELRIADIADPENPELISTIGTDPMGFSSDIRNVFFHPSEPWVFTANEGGPDAGWAAVDVSNPENPALFGSFSVAGIDKGVHNVTVFDEDYLITSLDSPQRGIVIYDISNPANPAEVGEFQKTDGNRGEEAREVHATHTRGDHAFLAHWDSGLVILDLSDPSDPVEVASFDYTKEEADVPLRNAHHAVPHPSRDICLVGEEVGAGEPGYKHVIEFDVNSGETELLTSFQFPQRAQQPTISQFFWWTGHFSNWGVGDQEDVLFSGDYKAGVQVFDLSDPENPDRIDQYYPTEGVGEVRAADPTRSELIDNVPFTWNARTRGSEYIYVSDITTGLYIFKFEGY